MTWEHRSFTRQCQHESRGVDHKRIDLELNSLGSDGWELVAVVPLFEDGVVTAMSYFVKRSRDEVSEKVSVGAGL